MKVLIIGSGGREHALYWKVKQSPHVDMVYCAPGNGGTENNVDIAANDIEGLLEFAKREDIDLTIVGPEDPLCMGIVDTFQEEGLRIFGPNKHGAQLEKSKDFSKNFMMCHGIPTAAYQTFQHFEDANDYIRTASFPLVVKADGLCMGKGVIICHSYEEAVEALHSITIDKTFGEGGNKVVIESYLDGYEMSLLCFVANNRLIPMESARDYKKISEGDVGENTGGVGCYSPGPKLSEGVEVQILETLRKIEMGLVRDGFTYNGVLYVGFMIENDIPYVLEFNARFGDPETEVLMPRLKSDLIDVINHIENDTLQPNHLEWDKRHALATIVVSQGYPGTYEKGIPISNLDTGLIFHNGTKNIDGKLVSVGGRVLTYVDLGEDLSMMNQHLNHRIEALEFKAKYFRRDIGL